MAHILVRAYDHGRSDSVSDLGARWWRLLAALTRTVPKLSSWQARDPDGTLSPLEERDARLAMRRAGRYWSFGDKELIAYGPVAYASDAGIRTAEVALVCGVERLPTNAWIPNQTIVTLLPTAGVAISNREVCELLLRAVVSACDPAWAHVAIDSSPRAAAPPFDNGAPILGWLSYLSRAYPAAPPALPEPAVAYQVEGGTIFAAHPKQADSASIDRLDLALRVAGVLLPARIVAQKKR